jgi:hypothetical protein
MNYNGTAYKRNADGKVVSVQAVELDADGKVIRAAGYWTYSVGTPAYDAEWRASQFSMVATIEIARDGAAGYRQRLAGLGLPPAYTGEEVSR